MCLILALLLVTAADEPTSFRTGRNLDAALETKVSWSSIGSDLADQLTDMQTQTEVLILRDRRIDPHRQISVKTEFVPRVQVLKQISVAIPDGALCVTENFACIGPSAAMHGLPILFSHNNEQINSMRKKIDAAAFRRLTAKIDASWEQLAEPRRILLDRAMIAGIVIRNPDAIPHDVWADQRLPGMPFAEFATFILNQFELTFEVASGETSNQAELTIVPIDPQATFEHRYAVGSKLKSTIVATWKTEAPDIEIEWAGSNARITTTLERHARLNGLLYEALYSGDGKSTYGTHASSIRTTNYQIKAERATIGQLIDFFRSQKVMIDVKEEDSAEVVAILKESVQLDTLTERQPGAKLFPLIFSQHFRQVDVRDDRVILSLK